MSEAELKQQISTFHKQLNILREREAKYGTNAPLELLNQIEDYQIAIELLESRLAGDISDEDLQAQLAPLNLSYSSRGETKIISMSGNFVQIGALVVPVLPLALAAVGLLALLGFVSYRSIFPALPPTPTVALGPTKMSLDKLLRVAVAQIGQKDANGQIQPSADGAQLSRWIADSLKGEYDNLPADLKGKVQLWHDDLPLTEKGAEIGLIGDAVEAAAKAEALRANLVIYGYLSEGHFEPQFYVGELRGETTEIDEISGPHQLGAPIKVITPISPDDIIARVNLQAQVGLRAKAMRWFTTGFIYELAGQTVTAYETFIQAKEDLKEWEDRNEGKEILYYFLGQEALILSRSEAEAQKFFASAEEGRKTAAGYFRYALDNCNAHYARAYLGLGSVAYQRAQNQKDPERRLAAPDLDEAIKNYEQAVDYAPNLPGDYTAQAARYGLAIATALKGSAYLQLGEYDEADVYFVWTLKEIKAILESPLGASNQHRLLAQIYQAQAATYQQQAYIRERQGSAGGDSAALQQQARDAYNHCIAQGDLAPDDRVLDKIINTYCRP